MTSTPRPVIGAAHILERARWAAQAFSEYSAEDVERIVDAVADVAHEHAEEYAEWAVRETGFGVAEHKTLKNRSMARALADAYRGADFASPRIDQTSKIVSIPRPAGVVLALTPSTNPVSTLYFKVLLALKTRNAIVVSPHPMARECCSHAAATLAAAAEQAGAPSGAIQWIERPTIPLVEELMANHGTNLILATGGTGVVRSAYSSANPALGVGPGNVPVLVDGSADLREAARHIVESKAFDNSVLCTNESVLIAVTAVADRLRRELERAGAAVLTQADTELLRSSMFPSGRLDPTVIGKDATWIAARAGIRVGPRTKVLVAPFDAAVPDEPLTHEKLSPVLGMITVPDSAAGIRVAQSVIRVAGAGHSAAIHSTDADTVLRFSAAVPVLRVSVNVGNSLGGSGGLTNLAPTMTIGTGFVGRSSLGENLRPDHLVDWTRIAYAADPAAAMPDFTGLSPSSQRAGATPPYPRPSNGERDVRPPKVLGMHERVADAERPSAASEAVLREEVRRLVMSELSKFVND
ncbi:acyl-CoA reductase-like NAD-dependent aldehyde dehydrogenase [Nocardioides thalensis]|uniref:Acyl-CoA reductase-like NAD-dependent aldehyde dehydrogenase n=1 Tax=Nocardioides thalensis TaxID=1914755 RepID=A0A853BUT1_9ACTN|nr:aldehyde dehydrogenase family protein [Nocardioides thalensis]NYI99619.1 acyl-CoA reductase-like NAD-dependent aldehyde dehydrogenase [Nocardioides thalensis]